ncbi:hypothetical protein [Bacillus paramycoides]|uniref:hypothetical protein n=1 Tax=Bacillus paramycoides TaxID=2026194 RepID=UPI001FD1019A|nr:hypothetical protein [Bacillus paramycoides]
MWKNEQGYSGGYPYYQRNCSNPVCLNPYCQCGENCRFSFFDMVRPKRFILIVWG